MAGNAIFLPASARNAYAPIKKSALRYTAMKNQPNSFGITRKLFDDLERFYLDNQQSQVKAAQGIDLLVRAMCMITKGGAQRRSMGPVAGRRRSNPALAYRIPVQRITGRYFAGWTQRRIGPGRWLLYNDSIEAFLIETGTHMRVRRPILKLSLIGMLRFIQTSRTANQFVDWVLAPRRDSRGRFQSFNARLAGTATLGSMAGPSGKLPG